MGYTIQEVSLSYEVSRIANIDIDKLESKKEGHSLLLGNELDRQL